MTVDLVPAGQTLATDIEVAGLAPACIAPASLSRAVSVLYSNSDEAAENHGKPSIDLN